MSSFNKDSDAVGSGKTHPFPTPFFDQIDLYSLFLVQFPHSRFSVKVPRFSLFPSQLPLIGLVLLPTKSQNV